MAVTSHSKHSKLCGGVQPLHTPNCGVPAPVLGAATFRRGKKGERKKKEEKKKEIKRGTTLAESSDDHFYHNSNPYYAPLSGGEKGKEEKKRRGSEDLLVSSFLVCRGQGPGLGLDRGERKEGKKKKRGGRLGGPDRLRSAISTG